MHDRRFRQACSSSPSAASPPLQDVLAPVAGPAGTTLTFSAANWNAAPTVTITSQWVDTTTTYVTIYEIGFTPVSSTDPGTAGFPIPPLPVFEATSTPPLKKVWHSGLVGMETLAPLGVLALLRRRRRLRDRAI